MDFLNPATDIDLSTALTRLGIIFILSFVIGFEREKDRQPAGLRTHILIGIGSTMMMILSLYIPQWAEGRFDSDPTRIAAQVITGIGFLGAGAIVKIGMNIRGITTAANIWVICAIGLSVGAGLYIVAGIVTAVTLLTLVVLNKIEHRITRKGPLRELNIYVDGDSSQLNTIKAILVDRGIAISDIAVKESIQQSKTKLTFRIHIPDKTSIAELMQDFRQVRRISDIELKECYK